MKPKYLFLLLGIALGVSCTLAITWYYDEIFLILGIESDETPRMICVMVDKTYGNPLRCGKVGTYYWAVIEGRVQTEHPTSKSPAVYHFTIGYHLTGCEHTIDFREESTTREGFELVYLWPYELFILEDGLTTFNTSRVVAKELIALYNRGGILTW